MLRLTTLCLVVLYLSRVCTNPVKREIHEELDTQKNSASSAEAVSEVKGNELPQTSEKVPESISSDDNKDPVPKTTLTVQPDKPEPVNAEENTNGEKQTSPNDSEPGHEANTPKEGSEDKKDQGEESPDLDKKPLEPSDGKGIDEVGSEGGMQTTPEENKAAGEQNDSDPDGPDKDQSEKDIKEKTLGDGEPTASKPDEDKGENEPDDAKKEQEQPNTPDLNKAAEKETGKEGNEPHVDDEKQTTDEQTTEVDDKTDSDVVEDDDDENQTPTGSQEGQNEDDTEEEEGEGGNVDILFDGQDKSNHKTENLGKKRKGKDEQFEESTESSHFFAYLVSAIILVAVLYIASHNKRKIIAFVVEGRRSRGSRRPKTSDYQKLDQH